MPPKRTLPSANLSPPPSPGSNFNTDHHHSPIAGLYPDIPLDSATASASPQSKRFKEADMPPIPSSPNQSPESSRQLPEAKDLLTCHPAASTGGATVLASSPTANGGAREAYLATQQQRAVTCNLSLIPPSEREIAPQFIELTLTIRHPTKNPPVRHHHCDVYPTIRTTCPHVHAGCGQGRCCRSHSVGGHC